MRSMQLSRYLTGAGYVTCMDRMLCKSEWIHKAQNNLSFIYETLSAVKRLLLIKDCIHEGISNRLNLKNSSYPAVLKILGSHLLPKNLKY